MNKKKVIIGSILALVVLSALAAQVLKTDERFGGSTRFVSSSQYQISVDPLDDAVLRIDFINKPAGVFTNFSNPIYLTRTGLVANIIIPSGSGSSLWTNDGTYLRPASIIPVGGLYISNTFGTLNVISILGTNVLAAGVWSDAGMPSVDLNFRRLQTYPGGVDMLNWSNNLQLVISAPVIAPQVSLTTNVAVQAPNFTLGAQQFQTNAAFTVLAPTGFNNNLFETVVFIVTNSTAAAVLITAPANVHTEGTWYVTNVTTISFSHMGSFWTNAISYPLW